MPSAEFGLDRCNKEWNGENRLPDTGSLIASALCEIEDDPSCEVSDDIGWEAVTVAHR